jgi:hypothetical protein
MGLLIDNIKKKIQMSAFFKTNLTFSHEIKSMTNHPYDIPRHLFHCHHTSGMAIIIQNDM